MVQCTPKRWQLSHGIDSKSETFGARQGRRRTFLWDVRFNKTEFPLRVTAQVRDRPLLSYNKKWVTCTIIKYISNIVENMMPPQTLLLVLFPVRTCENWFGVH